MNLLPQEIAVPEVDHCPINSPPVRIEPDNRLVVLARTIQVGDSEAEAALSDGVIKWVRFGDTCLGQALYRHRSVFQNASDAPMWSHFELTYFREIVPAKVILELVSPPLSKAVHLLRAEILLTTPSSCVFLAAGRDRRIDPSVRHPWNISACSRGTFASTEM
jgi:hypothetical protein